MLYWKFYNKTSTFSYFTFNFVLSGLSDKFDFDLSLVRFLFIIFTVVNFGLGILIYILLAMVMPYKEDIEEEMYGTGPRKRKEAEAIEDDKDGWFW